MLEQDSWPASRPGLLRLDSNELEIEKKFKVKSSCKTAKNMDLNKKIEGINLDIIINRSGSLK